MEIRETDWCVTYYANNMGNLVAVASKVVKTGGFMCNGLIAALLKTSMLLNEIDSVSHKMSFV